MHTQLESSRFSSINHFQSTEFGGFIPKLYFPFTLNLFISNFNKMVANRCMKLIKAAESAFT